MPTFVDQSQHQQSMEESVFLITIDDFPRLMWVKILKNKLEAFRVFKKLKTLSKSESKEAMIKFLRT